jgi:hypothetical protein
VYPGIDLIYYGNQRQLEYDFVVNPGADPNKILLDFQSAAKPTLEYSGDFVMHTTGGDLRWHNPVAYQEFNGTQTLVGCAYARKETHRLGFKLAAYDPTKPLIIDPVLEYSTYLGGSGSDAASAVAVDRKGNAYVTGSATSTDFPSKDAFQKSYPGFPATIFGNSRNSTVAFVTAFDATGKLVYSTYLGTDVIVANHR